MNLRDIFSQTEASPPENPIKESLRSLITDFANVKWQAVTRQNLNFNKIGDFALLVAFTKKLSYKTKNNTPQPKLIIRMGGSLATSLGWQIGDKLMLAYNENDPTIMCLVKGTNGFKLTHDSHTHVKRVQVAADFMKDLPEQSQREVLYEVDKKNNRLLFKFETTNQNQ